MSTRDPAVEALPAQPCDYCDTPIVWTTSTATRTPLPIDAAPSDTGNIFVERRPDGSLAAGVASVGAARSARVIGRPTYEHHANSCPFASAWNKAAAPARSTRPRPRPPTPARRR